MLQSCLKSSQCTGLSLVLYTLIQSFQLISERRIIYDFEQFGDSPTCLGDPGNLDGVNALVQGFGLNEKGESPQGLLETRVEIISNKKCQDSMNWRLNAKKFPQNAKEFVLKTLPNGIDNHILCTQGYLNEDSGFYSVSVFLFWTLTLIQC